MRLFYTQYPVRQPVSCPMLYGWLVSVLDQSGSFSRNHLQKTSNRLPLCASPNSTSRERRNSSKVAIVPSSALSCDGSLEWTPLQHLHENARWRASFELWRTALKTTPHYKLDHFHNLMQISKRLIAFNIDIVYIFNRNPIEPNK